MASFNVGTTFCRDQFLDLENTSTSAQTYQWDFCLNDFSTLKSSQDIAAISGLSGGYGFRLVQDNNNWFGFATSVNNNKLFRLQYGASLNNVPVITDLGSLGKLVLPEGIDLIKENGNWYGFVGSLDFSSPVQGIIRLDFGNSLVNMPTAVNLGNFGYNVRFREVKVVKQGADLILIAINYNDGSIIRINYRNNFTNSIGPSDIFDSGPIANASLPIGIDLVKKNSSWIGMLTSLANSEVIQLNFGSDLLSVPAVQAHYTFASVNRPYKVRMIQEGNNYYGVIGNETLPLAILDFKDLDPVNTPVSITTASLPVLLGIDVIRINGRNTIMGVASAGTGLRRIVFEANCSANKAFSDEHTPAEVKYSDAGAYAIELITYGGDPAIRSVASATVNVSSSIAPDIIFSSQNVCAQHDILFTSQNISGDITTYAWNFGDSQTSAQPNPPHSYTRGGDYIVSLLVTASNGCQNSVSEPLTVYNPPQANFTLPASGTICTNQEYEFINTSTYDVFEPTWQWQIDNLNQSAAKDGSFAFPAATDYEVKLTASILGCSTSLTQNFNVQAVGPTVDFTMTGVCQNEPVEFASDITGQFTSLQWNFGDGTNSSFEDPTHNYATIGNYNVLLTAVSASGCQNSIEKPITIYSKPQPNFSIDLPPFSCAGSPSQFNDLTPPLTDSNIATWTWHFGDAANGTSPQKNPTYIYTLAGDYQVSLETETNFGCTNTIQKTITISQAPVVDFTHDASCLNQGTQFHDASGSNVKAWLWTIQNNTYTSQNPIHSFNTTGDQSATLAVTGNNNCVSQVSKTLFIPTPVNIDFTAQSTCASKPSFFQETSTAGSDPATSWRWDFGGQQALGSPVQHVFQNTGNYNVRLYSTRQSGCVYSVSKSISVVAPPVAQFSMSPGSGAAPLAVGFTNTSSGASSFLWKFNDANNSTSTLFSPSFTYSALGEYPVDLIARNANGCSDTLQKIVQVVVPQINLAMTELTLFNNGDGSLRANVTIRNDGNLTIQNPDVYLNLAGKAQVKEKISGPVLPGQSITRTLATSILPTNLKYACAEVFVNGDTNQFDNEKCINLADETVFISPYPNPANEIVYLEWVNTNLESLDLVIYNSLGQPVLSKTYSGLLTGLNQVELYVGNLAEGIYFATYITGNRTFSTRFSIVR